MPKQPIATTTDYANRLTIQQAANTLGVSNDTIRRRIKDRTLPAVMVAGRYRIRAEDLGLLVETAA